MGLFGDKWNEIKVNESEVSYKFNENELTEAKLALATIDMDTKLQDKWSFNKTNKTLTFKSDKPIFKTNISFGDIQSIMKEIKKMFKEMVKK